MGWFRGWFANRRRKWATIVGLAVVGLVVHKSRGQRPAVEVAKAERGPLRLTIAASGKVEATASDLSFNDGGTIVELYVEEGNEVAEEQVLARIQPGLEMGRVSGTPDVIRAPYNGWVVAIYQREGAVVQQGVPVLRLVQRGKIWVTAYIESEDAVHVHAGDRFECRAGGYLAKPWTMTVAAVGHEAVPREDVPGSARQVRVRMRPAQDGFSLPAGTPVDIDGEVAMLDDALLIPAAAVRREGAKSHVWVVQDDRAYKREVRTGVNNFRSIAILDGLKAGETVAVSNKAKLEEGQRVTVQAPPETES